MNDVYDGLTPIQVHRSISFGVKSSQTSVPQSNQLAFSFGLWTPGTRRTVFEVRPGPHNKGIIQGHAHKLPAVSIFNLITKNAAVCDAAFSYRHYSISFTWTSSLASSTSAFCTFGAGGSCETCGAWQSDVTYGAWNSDDSCVTVLP